MPSFPSPLPSSPHRPFVPLAVEACVPGLVLVLALVSNAARADAHFDVDPDTGYRMERYRAPVPESVPAARRSTRRRCARASPTARLRS